VGRYPFFQQESVAQTQAACHQLACGTRSAGKWNWRGGIFGDDGGIQEEFIKMTGCTDVQSGVNYMWTLGKRAFILLYHRRDHQPGWPAGALEFVGPSVQEA